MLAFGLLLSVDCGAPMQRPVVTSRGTLGPGLGEFGADPAARPFRVVFSAPKGQAPGAGEISIVFSRPVRSLELAEHESPPPVAIEPSIAGRWQWIGTHALSFVPERGRLPGATEFQVEVPAQTRALDGTSLGQPYRFAF
ncbi:hypothetical protein ACFL5O_12195, partial [Myxococcota bacterium]